MTEPRLLECSTTQSRPSKRWGTKSRETKSRAAESHVPGILQDDIAGGELSPTERLRDELSRDTNFALQMMRDELSRDVLHERRDAFFSEASAATPLLPACKLTEKRPRGALI